MFTNWLIELAISSGLISQMRHVQCVYRNLKYNVLCCALVWKEFCHYRTANKVTSQGHEGLMPRKPFVCVSVWLMDDMLDSASYNRRTRRTHLKTQTSSHRSQPPLQMHPNQPVQLSSVATRTYYKLRTASRPESHFDMSYSKKSWDMYNKWLMAVFHEDVPVSQRAQWQSLDWKATIMSLTSNICDWQVKMMLLSTVREV